MKAVMRYLSVLLLYIQRRLEGGKGTVISIKTRAVCERDMRCNRAVNSLMMKLAERGVVRHHKRGVYLIERRVAEEVLNILKQNDGWPSGDLRNTSGTDSLRRGGRQEAAS